MTFYHQGYFKPKNKLKYKGNYNDIVFRSSLELKYMCWLDDNKDVLEWSSEEIHISYRDKATGRPRIYFPDFWYRTEAKQYLVEIKPASQCKPPTGKKTPAFIQEVRTYATNTSKWQAAEKFAERRGWEFRLITEKDLAKL
jgi:hypothetical protein